MSTPGSYKKIFYSGASDSFPFTFKKSDGSAYDISSYSSYELNFYKINETTVDTSVSMTLTGTNVLDNTFTVSDIQALPKAGRYELLLTNSAEDKDITVRDSFEVTDVQGDETVTSGTEVTIDTEGVVVNVDSVNLYNELSAIKDKGNKDTPEDTDRIAGQESGGTVFSTTFAKLKEWIQGFLLIDEDDFSSDSTNKAPTQQSTKAYVDSQKHLDDINAQTEKTDLDGTEKIGLQETGGGNKSATTDTLLYRKFITPEIVEIEASRDGIATESVNGGNISTSNTGYLARVFAGASNSRASALLNVFGKFSGLHRIAFNYDGKWSNRLRMYWNAGQLASDGVFRFNIGSDGAGALTDKGYSIRIDSSRNIWFDYHDGTSLTENDTSTIIPANDAFELLTYSDGPTIYLLKDGTEIFSVSNPISGTELGHFSLTAEAEQFSSSDIHLITILQWRWASWK